MKEAISSRPPVALRAPRVVAGGLFGLFLLVGLAISGWVFGVPLARVFAARGWIETPCTIATSRVAEHSDGDGRVYRVEVQYVYQAGGVQYIGDRYKFLGGMSSGYRGKARVVARLAPGTQVSCWVNPADPTDSVLERGLTADFAFVIVPLLFVVVGAMGLGVPLYRRGTAAVRHATSGGFVAGWIASRSSLARRRRQWYGLIGAALFWNSMVGVLVYQAVSGGIHGHMRWFALAIGTPFTLIGVGLAVAIVNRARELATPMPQLAVESAIVPLGGKLRFDWGIVGRQPGLVRRLTIELVGEETAVLRLGDEEHPNWNSHVFARITAVDDKPPAFSGSERMTVPDASMHSFAAPNCRIEWSLRAVAQVDGWPDTTDSIPITVEPLR